MSDAATETLDPLSSDLSEEERGHLRSLLLELDGFSGPIDVLLQLARDQKVDLLRLSILHLAEQYLAFVALAREQHLELAADYLVMAAWLAYLKSRLLLPPEANDEEPSGEELAAALQFQLQRLQAMQDAAQKLLARPQLGQQVFARGAPDPRIILKTSHWSVTLFDVLKAYGDHHRRKGALALEIEPLTLYSVDEALRRLEQVLGMMLDWTVLSQYLPTDLDDPLMRRSAVCAHFIASLELVKQGKLDLEQHGGPFSPLYIRRRLSDD